MRRRFMILSGLIAVLTVFGAGAASAATAPWTVQTTPSPPGAQNPLFSDVSCASAKNCIAVGGYNTSDGNDQLLAEHWNGHTWTIQDPSGPTAGVLRRVSCISATSCTAVGYIDSVSTETPLLAEHWNGHTWSVQSTPDPSGADIKDLYFAGVSCASAASCIAIGTYFDSATSAVLPVTEHWNGSTWSIQATPDPVGATSNQLFGISCTSATTCTAVGLYNTGEPPGPTFLLAEHS